MIQLRVNGEEVPLLGTSSMELQRENPLFSEGAELAAEASTPVSIPYTKRVSQLLGLPFHFTTERIKKSFDCEVWDETGVRCQGRLVVEASLINLNSVEDNVLQGYVLTNLSAFYNRIKNKKLRDLAIAESTFPWTTSDAADLSGGFWQHVHETWLGADEPWIFAPIRNEIGNQYFEWFNKPNDTTVERLDYTFNIANDRLAPMLQVKYILQQIFQLEGFTPDFSPLDGTGWEKLYLFSNVTVEWRQRNYTYTPGVGYSYTYSPKTNIAIKPARHLPNRNISALLLYLSTRYGFQYLIDYGRRNVTVTALRNILDQPNYDWTQWVEPVTEPSHTQDAQKFAFVNSIDQKDQYNQAPSFDDVQLMPSVASFSALPTPSPDYENKVIFCFRENAYYQCQYEDAPTYDFVWNRWADNIGNYNEKDATNSISTEVYAPGMLFTNHRSNVYGFFPVVGYEPGADFGFCTMLWHGMSFEVLADFTATLGTYAYASNHRNKPDSTNPLPWSNTYRHVYNNEDFGLYTYWWKDWIQLIKNTESISVKLNMPLHVLRQHRWADKVLIKNVEFVVASIIEPVPYDQHAQAVLRRLNKTKVYNIPDGTGNDEEELLVNITLQLRAKDYALVQEVVAQYSTDLGATWTDVGAADVYDTSAGQVAGVISVASGSTVWIAVLKASDYSDVQFGFFIAPAAACGKTNPAKPGTYTTDATLEYYINATAGGNVISC